MKGSKYGQQKVKAFCNANLAGFRKLLNWIETQQTAIDPSMLSAIQWKHKDVAGGALYDFLAPNTQDDALRLVERQGGNGPEAWRQLCLRYDPVGESFVFDQMASLIEVERCTKMTEIPDKITK